MKLYATITDERLTARQEGEELMIEIKGENRETISRIKAIQTPDLKYLIQVFPVLHPDVLRIETLGYGYETRIKAKKRKSEATVRFYCDRHIPHTKENWTAKEICEKGTPVCPECDEDMIT